MGRHVAAKVSEDFGDLLYSVAIPRTTRLSEMALRGKPAVIYDRRSAGSRAYFDLADELVYRFVEDAEADRAESDAMLDSTRPAEAVSIPGDLQAEAYAWENANRETSDPIEEKEEPVAPKPGNGGGLDRLLADLGGSREVSSPIPAFEEPSSPEMVSLDELLAEEESGAGESDEWGNETWPARGQSH